MNPDVVLMGMLQGITEFLPISSSGHLSLAKAVLGFAEPNLQFDLILHMATLFSIIVYFFNDIITLLMEWFYGFLNRNARNWPGWRFGWAVIFGSMITAPLGFLIKPYAETAAVNLLWLGGNFWITGFLLLSSRFIAEGDRSVRIRDGAFVGLIQGLAVMPGISRSGSTIWAALVAGLSRDEAFKFSFLLSVPAIVGATFFEAKDVGGFDSFFSSLPPGWIVGAVFSFLSGLVSLILLKKLVTSEKWWFFSIYCILIGCVAVISSIMGV